MAQNKDRAKVARTWRYPCYDRKYIPDNIQGSNLHVMVELISIHDELEELVGYEGFCDGFILGVRLMMEVACDQGRFSENE